MKNVTRLLLLMLLMLITVTCFTTLTIHAGTTISFIEEMVELNGTNDLLTYDFDHILHDANNVAQIKLNEQAYQIGVGDQVQLDVFSNKSFLFKIVSSKTDINGTYVWRGKGKDGHLILTNNGGVLLAHFSNYGDDRQYTIQYEESNSRYYLYEIQKGSTVVPEGEHLEIPELEGDIKLPMTTTNTDELVTIDVMVVYTPAALSYLGSTNQMNNVIATAFEKAQLSLDNSQVNMNLNLVHSTQVDYYESGNDAITDLRKLTFSTSWDPWGYDPNGEMDEVHNWRNSYNADLVVMLTNTNDVGGVGWLLNNAYGAPQWGYSITRIQQASSTYTMIHEIGHNMGAHHRKDQATQPGPGIFSYSAGWRWIGSDGGRYASVMSYEEDSYNRVPYFSNPNIYYQGVTTGTSNDDNARTLRETKGVVAEYRGDIQTPTLLSATAYGDTVELVYDEVLKSGYLSAVDYTVETTGVDTTVLLASASDTTVTLSLSDQMYANDLVYLSYLPGTYPIQDLAGNQALGFSDVLLDNLSPGFTIDDVLDESFLVGKDVYYRYNSMYTYENVMKSIEETGGSIYYKYNGRWYDIVNNSNIQSTADYVEANAVSDSVVQSWQLRKWYQ